VEWRVFWHVTLCRWATCLPTFRLIAVPSTSQWNSLTFLGPLDPHDAGTAISRNVGMYSASLSLSCTGACRLSVLGEAAWCQHSVRQLHRNMANHLCIRDDSKNVSTQQTQHERGRFYFFARLTNLKSVIIVSELSLILIGLRSKLSFCTD
jgi:hypothetical protein